MSAGGVTDAATVLARMLDDAIVEHNEAVEVGDINVIQAYEPEIAALRMAIAALAQPPVADTRGAVDQDGWHAGCPDRVYGSEWFIAETTYGDRVVLRALPEEYAYDYKTADETHIMADRIKRWMQFPDSSFIPFQPPQPAGWQPIETVPKDGTPILVWGTHGADVASWWSGDEQGARAGWETLDGSIFHPGTFTHWMPLPPTPADRPDAAADGRAEG